MSSDTRDPPDPPAMTAGARSSWRNSPASTSACMADSELPAKHTSEAPVLGLSQTSTRFPVPARVAASSWSPGVSLLNRPPGVRTQGSPSPTTS